GVVLHAALVEVLHAALAPGRVGVGFGERVAEGFRPPHPGAAGLALENGPVRALPGAPEGAVARRGRAAAEHGQYRRRRHEQRAAASPSACRLVPTEASGSHSHPPSVPFLTLSRPRKARGSNSVWAGLAGRNRGIPAAAIVVFRWRRKRRPAPGKFPEPVSRWREGISARARISGRGR